MLCIYVLQGSFFRVEISQCPAFRITHSKVGDQRAQMFLERRYLKKFSPKPSSGLIFRVQGF